MGIIRIDKKIYGQNLLSALSWETLTLWTLRTCILLSGLHQIVSGAKVIGIVTLVAFAFVMIPKFFTKNRITELPFEIEFVFLAIVFITAVLGEARGFYAAIPYYDKFVHSVISFCMGLLGFLFLYALRSRGRINMSRGAMVLLVILVTLGVEVFWELFEYASDQMNLSPLIAWQRAQGNALEDPYHDTMNDLVVDTIGVTVGTMLAYFSLKNGLRRASYPFNKILRRIRDMVDVKRTDNAIT
jgi:ABC-type Fe3+-siderophore transport system permease subunit